ncbi:MAG: hypothetical protein ETSY1_30740 [Candidatus Entotheonella factor]|uniref:SWIM-type domain-containing protein n=1 Tax=Entotheonella factor TaxID=1429438 RepID=W4LBF2_ENTF1|nr:MAG: hypothetical protein ETSY1_30740 [Candidatus Entotheonella factor]
MTTATANGHSQNGTTDTIDLKAWRDAVAIMAQRAHDHYGPEMAGRISKARIIVLDGLVQHGQEIAYVTSETDPERSYEVTREGCDCQDAKQKAPEGMCKHRLAWMIYRGAYGIARELTQQRESAPASETSEPGRIPSEMTVDIRGKQFVTYTGLLALAQQQGLQSLDVRFIDVQAEMATAIATATFQDGRSFTECGDATPGNVNTNIKPHFARMALTRAKARALRDALNIGMCSVEELSE